MVINAPVVGERLSTLHPQQFVRMVTSNRHLERSQGKANERRHTLKLRTITFRSNLCQRLPCRAKAHANRCVLSTHYCLKQAGPWTLCVLVCAACVYTYVCWHLSFCVCSCVYFIFIIIIFFYTDSWLAFFHTHTKMYTHSSVLSHP